MGSTARERSDFRLVSATNANLAAEVQADRFRSDLYARVAGFTIHVPPLRSRRADVVLLARAFAQRAAPERALVLTVELLEALALYPWPRNVRELRSAIDRMVVLSAGEPVLKLRLLPEELRTGSARPRPGGETPGREELLRVLTEVDGNVAELARRYDKDARQVYRWLHQHGIDAAAARAAPEPLSREELVEALARSGGSVSDLARQLGVSRRQVYRWLDKHAIDVEAVRDKERG